MTYHYGINKANAYKGLSNEEMMILNGLGLCTFGIA